MNERIKQLAEQAGIVNRKFSFGQWWETDLTPEQKKFVELIVRECLALTLGKDRRQLLDKGDLNGAHLVQRDIIQVIKHFGVEE